MVYFNAVFDEAMSLKGKITTEAWTNKIQREVQNSWFVMG